MVSLGFESFADKKILLLQGPVGPFFKLLADDFKRLGAEVHKINFNGGDCFFYPGDSIDFRGSLKEWPDFFAHYLKTHRIDIVILFGDCRAYHRAAHTIAHNEGIEIGVFEEGYVRPDYITFERFGVNGFSLIPREREFYDALAENQLDTTETVPVGNTFWYMARWAFLYYLFSVLWFPVFRYYRHHRPLNLWEITYWIRSAWRKWQYKYTESGMQHYLTTTMDKHYYLVPLQISTDAQVCEHSAYTSIENFIEKILGSFAVHSPKDTLLVIKHHPLDRGYHDYSGLIRRISTHFGIHERVVYIHDQHLPTLLEHARGVVVINSTVGLSAIHHNTPLKTCGTAIYNMEGLTFQGTLDEFWKEAPSFAIDRRLYERFKGYLIANKQINGSFYRRLKSSVFKSGIIW